MTTTLCSPQTLILQKAIYVTGPRGSGLTKPVALQLCGRALPWVARAEHLGHALSEDGTMRRDAVEKRAQFIDCSVKIRESFSFAHPEEHSPLILLQLHTRITGHAQTAAQQQSNGNFEARMSEKCGEWRD